MDCVPVRALPLEMVNPPEDEVPSALERGDTEDQSCCDGRDVMSNEEENRV